MRIELSVLLWCTLTLSSQLIVILSASVCETSTSLITNTMSEANKTALSEDKFNYTILFDNFKRALSIENEDVDLEFYLIGYEELCK